MKSIKQGPAEPKAALAELREIYFRTTKRTIAHDFEHAIELLKSLPTEEEREKATVYMEGIAQLRKEWGGTGSAERTGSQTGKRRRVRGKRDHKRRNGETGTNGEAKRNK